MIDGPHVLRVVINQHDQVALVVDDGDMVIEIPLEDVEAIALAMVKAAKEVKSRGKKWTT